MGILDNITGQTNTAGGNTRSAVVSALLGLLANQSQGGLSGLVQRFAGSGLGDVVNSWIGTGPNKPVTPQQVEQGLGSDTINQVSSQTGVGREEVKTHLAQVLPQLVDRLTPQGNVPPQQQQHDLLSQGMSMLKGLF